MYKIIKDDKAIANIDFMFAIVLVMASVAMAIQIMPGLSHEDRSWRIEQYMTATRATDNLVQDDGGSWEANWTAGNYLNVTKIGLVYVDNDNKAFPKVLDKTKLDTLMEGSTDPGTGLRWWKFPPNSTDCSNISQGSPERQNVSRALGISGYNLCMLLHPADTNYSNTANYPVPFNFTRLDDYLGNITKMQGASTVDRYVFIVNPDIPGELADKYLKEDEYLKINDEPPIVVHYRLNVWVW